MFLTKVTAAPPRLTDEMVIAMRKACREDSKVSHTTLSQDTGISISTLSKAIRGVTYAHLNHIEKPFIYQPFKVSDQDVIDMRLMAATATHAEVCAAFSHLDIHPSTMEKIVRGTVYTHLNTIAPPVKKDIRLTERKEQARAMSQKGISYKAIASQLDVALSSVSHWCRDIVEQRPEIVTAPGVAKPKQFNRRLAPVDEILTLYKAGMRVEEISKKVGFSQATIRRICTNVVRDVPLVNKGNPRGLGGPLGEFPYQDYHLYFYKDRNDANMVRMVHRTTREIIGTRYARYRMSVHLKRHLAANEQVQFKEGVSDEIDNLYITTFSDVRHCAKCEKEIEAHRSRAVYCSQECRWAAKYDSIRSERTCRGCDAKFETGNRAQRYCTEECKKTTLHLEQAQRRQAKRALRPAKVECVICEGMFLPNAPDRDICYSRSCNELVQGVEEYDAEAERCKTTEAHSCQEETV